MKRLIATLAVGCIGLLSSSGLIAQPVAKQTTYALVVCESINNQQSFCKADAYLGVQLVREISRNRCFEDRTYGFESGGIWINGGCRAEFEIGRGGSRPGPGPGGPGHGGPGHGGPGQPGGEIVLCESLDGRRAYCDAPTRGGVRMARQLSRNDCYEGQTWGYDQRGIWVDRGCRAEFELIRTGNPGIRPPGSGSGEYLGTVVCRSEGQRQQICPLDIGNNRIDLIRKISKAACVQGQTWGYDRRGVWVSNGCRGEFAVIRVAEPRLLICESVQERRQYCPANTVYGVEMSRQLSRNPCTEGYTWGYDRNAVWVDRGCRAEFVVQ